MWFMITLKKIVTGKATVPKGTLFKVLFYASDMIHLEAVSLTDSIGQPVRVLHNSPQCWLDDLGLKEL